MTANKLTVVGRVTEALKKRALQPDGLIQRLSDRIAFPQLYKHYTENFLTHGEQFLRGDDELPLFAPDVWHAPIKWRPIPGPNTVSLSRVSLTRTETGSAMLRGHYGGSLGELSLLTGEAKTTEQAPVGAGACGVGSTGHWPLNLAQHHWLELRLRTGAREFDLVLQADGHFEGSEKLWRASIPQMASESEGDGHAGGGVDAGVEDAGTGARLPPGRGGVGRGAYGILGVAPDARDAEIREKYRALVMEVHPDMPGGDEEQFKRVPFTAFRDRSLYAKFEQISAVYILLAGETPGSFAVEIGEVKAGRCEKGHSDGAGQWGHVSCEQGHCECGYYNGLRVEAFDGPLKLQANGRIRPDALRWGFAEHHYEASEDGW